MSYSASNHALGGRRRTFAFARLLVFSLTAAAGLAHVGGLVRAADPPRQVWVRLDAELLAPLIERPLDEVQAVDEEILGVRSIGEAHVSALPQVTVADDPDQAAFSVTVTGTIRSRTTGRRDPVQIYSRSITHFTATKRVVFHADSGFVGEAAEISAQSHCQPERIAPNRGGLIGRVIERRAWAQVAQSRQQVNAIVRAKAEAKIRVAFDRMVEQRLERVNRLAMRRMLVRAVVGGPQYVCWTRDGWLNIALSSADSVADDSRRQWVDALETARCRCKSLETDGAPIQVWVHEQVLGENLATLIRRVDLARLLWRQYVAAPLDPMAASVSFVSQASPSASYDFSITGPWVVIQAGDRIRHSEFTSSPIQIDVTSPVTVPATDSDAPQ
jgi:hypothetical protein